MQEDDFEICESILRQQKLLWERIDETLSEEIVQKCRNINGEYVWALDIAVFSGRNETRKHPASVDIALVYLSNK
ncbi:ShiA-like protein [Escherichia coli]|uniref:ShiA-like protein n=1 Tax=Escherichia coli TaxID=562 RepID=A0A376L3J5_ECOLX|nr:ShiA-like protein [Escherichia coli]